MIAFASLDQTNLIAIYNKNCSTASMSQSTETITFNIDKNIIQNLKFQEFVKKLQDSQPVIVIMNETHGMIIISGTKFSVSTSKIQIQNEIDVLSSNANLVKQKLTDRIELSVAQNNFLEKFGQEILEKIRKTPGISNTNIVNGKLQLSGDNTAITQIKFYLQQILHEKDVSITYNIKQHFELTCNGRILKEFSKKYRVGTSLQESSLQNEIKGKKVSKKYLRGARRGGYQTSNCNRGQCGRGIFSSHDSTSNDIPGFRNLNLNDYDANTRKNITDDHEQSKTTKQYHDTQCDSYEDNDDNNSQISDSDESVSSNRTTDSFNIKNFNNRTEQSITVSLCSDSEAALSKAIAELQSYSFNIESWIITEDELTFILKQQQQGKPMKKNMSIRERSIQIKFYFRRLAQNSLVHIYIYYTRGMWHVKVSGFKSDVHSTVFKIKSYLNDVVDTEIQIPISGAMAFFLKKKASSDINRLGNIHNIKIRIFSSFRRADNNDEDNNDNHCLKLIGPVARINVAQMDVENFLENLSEYEQDFQCDTWDISKNISLKIKELLKKIRDSDDYEAVGFVKFYNSAFERRQTAPKVTITVVGLYKERTDDVIQQCKDFVEGYVVWKLSLNEYRALHNILFVQKRPNITRFQQEWDTAVQFENENNTVIIPARSKIIADEIKEALQNLAAGKPNRTDSISVTIPIQLSTRRFVCQAIQPLLDEAKTQKVYINSKDRNRIMLHGRSEVITLLQEKINIIINDIKQKIITSHLTLPLIESELIRANSYEIVTRIERETNTHIRRIKSDTKVSKLNVNDDIDMTITCVVNSRGQTIHVKKGDITKVENVDAIINAAGGTLYHAGGVDKAISDAAGPELDQECKQLIANNGGVAIPTGKAVKTTAGRLPYKNIIHAIGPQYVDGKQQERLLLFSSVLSSLQLAEQEGYKSIALPAISAATYGFPLQDCTNIVIRAVKQFFANFPQSHLRTVVLIDIDDAACNSFAREIVKDHTNTDSGNNNDLMNYNLSPLTAKWCWQSDYGEKIYDDTHTRQIENDFQRYLQTFIPSTLKINADVLQYGGLACYSIHFLPNLKQKLTTNPNFQNNRLVCGYQMNEGTGFKRDIIRYPLQSQSQAAPVAYKPKPLDKYHLKVESKEDDWDIIGIKSVEVKQAEIEIKKAIASATISEPFSIHLSEDIDTHKTAITNIAIQQFIHVDFQQSSIGNLLLILKGFRQNILQAKLQISLYVQDILKIKADKDDELSIPKEWDDQEEQCKLVELPTNDPDFTRIEKRMKETLNNINIDKIERVQNIRMWSHYAFRRQQLEKELSHMPNLQIERELFHGSRNTPPSEIYNGECGFDMTYCTSGMWGIGTYFAQNASYSCTNYAHKVSNGKYQVFLAQVLTGDVYDCGSDSSLRRPPKKNEFSSSGLRYNSVSGSTGGSKVYIIYENRVAYPTYLITFTFTDGQLFSSAIPTSQNYTHLFSNPFSTQTLSSSFFLPQYPNVNSNPYKQ